MSLRSNTLSASAPAYDPMQTSTTDLSASGEANAHANSGNSSVELFANNLGQDLAKFVLNSALFSYEIAGDPHPLGYSLAVYESDKAPTSGAENPGRNPVASYLSRDPKKRVRLGDFKFSDPDSDHVKRLREGTVYTAILAEYHGSRLAKPIHFTYQRFSDHPDDADLYSMVSVNLGSLSQYQFGGLIARNPSGFPRNSIVYNMTVYKDNLTSEEFGLRPANSRPVAYTIVPQYGGYINPNYVLPTSFKDGNGQQAIFEPDQTYTAFLVNGTSFDWLTSPFAFRGSQIQFSGPRFEVHIDGPVDINNRASFANVRFDNNVRPPHENQICIIEAPTSPTNVPQPQCSALSLLSGGISERVTLADFVRVFQVKYTTYDAYLYHQYISNIVAAPVRFTLSKP